MKKLPKKPTDVAKAQTSAVKKKSDIEGWMDEIHAQGQRLSELNRAVQPKKPRSSKAVFEMYSLLEWRVLKGILVILNMYDGYRREAEKAFPADESRQSWHARVERQALRDSVQSFKVAGVIEDFHLVPPEVKYKGNWWKFDELPKQLKLKFVPTGEERDVT